MSDIGSNTLAFPYGSDEWRNAADWTSPDRHTTQAHISGYQADLIRVLDASRYCVRVVCSELGGIRPVADHTYEISPQDGGPLEIVFAFSPTDIAESLPVFHAVCEASARHWARFWRSGGRSISLHAAILVPANSNGGLCSCST